MHSYDQNTHTYSKIIRLDAQLKEHRAWSIAFVMMNLIADLGVLTYLTPRRGLVLDLALLWNVEMRKPENFPDNDSGFRVLVKLKLMKRVLSSVGLICGLSVEISIRHSEISQDSFYKML